MSTTRAHHCHATGCERNVRPEYLMCGPHWRRVPVAIQIRVLRTYRMGQCDDFNPSLEYCEAAKAAVIAVAELEKREPDTRLYEMLIRREEGES